MPTTTKAIPEIVDQLADERRLVDFDTYDISVQEIISMVNQDQIDIAPTYQRRFRWDVPRQSQFVESIFLGIPIPSLFMATNSDGTWEVVDGVQRLSTLAHFAGDDAARRALSIDGSLQLEGLEKLGAMNGLTFLGLPTSVQTQFKLRPIKITTLSDKSDKKVRFDLFERLNTGGVKLTDQEIRGCIFRGQFNDFLERMAGTPDFNRVVVLKKAMEYYWRWRSTPNSCPSSREPQPRPGRTAWSCCAKFGQQPRSRSARGSSRRMGRSSGPRSLRQSGTSSVFQEVSSPTLVFVVTSPRWSTAATRLRTERMRRTLWVAGLPSVSLRSASMTRR